MGRKRRADAFLQPLVEDEQNADARSRPDLPMCFSEGEILPRYEREFS
jgi:hypothetical protein